MARNLSHSSGAKLLQFFETPKCFAIYLWTHTSFLIYRIQLHVILCYLLDYSENIRIFAARKNIKIMTAIQMNAEILRNMSIIAEDENLLKRAAKYLRKLVSEKEADPTLLTKEEFFARVDEAREQIKRGEGVEMLPNESLDEFLQRVG